MNYCQTCRFFRKYANALKRGECTNELTQKIVRIVGLNDRDYMPTEADMKACPNYRKYNWAARLLTALCGSEAGK